MYSIHVDLSLLSYGISAVLACAVTNGVCICRMFKRRETARGYCYAKAHVWITLLRSICASIIVRRTDVTGQLNSRYKIESNSSLTFAHYTTTLIVSNACVLCTLTACAVPTLLLPTRSRRHRKIARIAIKSIRTLSTGYKTNFIWDKNRTLIIYAIDSIRGRHPKELKNLMRNNVKNPYRRKWDTICCSQ